MNVSGLAESRYLTIWWRPRSTIRTIVDSNPRSMVIVLIALFGFLVALEGWLAGNPPAFRIGTVPIPSIAPRTWILMNLGALVAVPVLAVIGLYLDGALIRWAGSLMNGTATAVEVRAAIAWSVIPAIASYVIYCGLASVGHASPRFHFGDMAPLWHWMMRFGWIFVALSAWRFIISLQCIGEVHRFSAWKALAARLITLLAVIGATFVLVVLIAVAAIPFLG